MRLAPDQVRQRFDRARIGYLATVTNDGAPHLVPVTFALSHNAIVTVTDSKPKSSTRLQRHRNIEAQPLASMLIDHYDEDWNTLWWARADGDADLVRPTNPGYVEAISALIGKYPQYSDNRPDGLMIRINVRRWLGWSYR
jgi:PPOX class probable F420-dependent enzyme